MRLEKFHKMGFAVICEHYTYIYLLSIVFFYIFQDGLHFFKRLCLRDRCSLFFLPVGDEQEKEQK